MVYFGHEGELFFVPCPCAISRFLFLPAIVTKEHTVPYGYDILRVGWIAALFGMFAWYSNLLAVIAFVCAKTCAYKTGIAFSFIAFLLGLLALTLRYIPTSEANFGTCGLPDIVPPCAPLDRLGIGFYVWLASFLVLAVIVIMRSVELLLVDDRAFQLLDK
jgi:hypothetical protein